MPPCSSAGPLSFITIPATDDGAAKLIAQYDAFEPLPGHKVKGALTVGENIGDLGGRVEHEALRLRIQLALFGCEGDAAACALECGHILGEGSGIAVEILAGSKLQPVDKEARHHRAVDVRQGSELLLNVVPRRTRDEGRPKPGKGRFCIDCKEQEHGEENRRNGKGGGKRRAGKGHYFEPTGQIVVTLHSQSMWGNSPETVVSQVVAEEFDVEDKRGIRRNHPARARPQDGTPERARSWYAEVVGC